MILSTFYLQLLKKMKLFNKITSTVDTGLITSTVNTRGVSIAPFASALGLPVGTELSGNSPFFFLKQ